MQSKLPYYMAYPMPLQYDDERLERVDCEYMKSLYPRLAKKILPYVEDECQRLEYECSIMYDEYPDRLMMSLTCKRIYESAIKKERLEAECLEEVRHLIEVLVCQEMCQKRRSRRRTRSKLY